MEKNLSVFEICLNHPLYEEVKYEEVKYGDEEYDGEEEDEVERDKLYVFYKTFGKQDGYCVYCESETVFSLNSSLWDRFNMESFYQFRRDRTFSIDFECARNKDHLHIFYFLQRDQIIQKIGQFPSLPIQQ